TTTSKSSSLPTSATGTATCPAPTTTRTGFGSVSSKNTDTISPPLPLGGAVEIEGSEVCGAMGIEGPHGRCFPGSPQPHGTEGRESGGLPGRLGGGWGEGADVTGWGEGASYSRT